MWAKGEYRPLSLEEGVERTFEMYKVFRRASIPVIRMGLQPTEEISEGGEAVAGPFHPAFRSLVESMLYRCAVEAKMERREFDGRVGSSLISGRSLSFLAGYRGENRRRWRKGIAVRKLIYTEEVPGNRESDSGRRGVRRRRGRVCSRRGMRGEGHAIKPE